MHKKQTSGLYLATHNHNHSDILFKLHRLQQKNSLVIPQDMVDLCLLKYLRSSLIVSQTLLAFTDRGPTFQIKVQNLVQRLKKLICNAQDQLVMTPVIRNSKGQPCPTSSGYSLSTLLCPVSVQTEEAKPVLGNVIM